MPLNCMFSECFRHYSFGIIASGLVLIGYELQMPLLGQFVPIELIQQFPQILQFLKSLFATLHALQAFLHLGDKLFVWLVLLIR